jgi:hypothetical protein
VVERLAAEASDRHPHLSGRSSRRRGKLFVRGSHSGHRLAESLNAADDKGGSRQECGEHAGPVVGVDHRNLAPGNTGRRIVPSSGGFWIQVAPSDAGSQEARIRPDGSQGGPVSCPDLLMAHRALTDTAVSIPEYKNNLRAIVAAGEEMAVAVLNPNERPSPALPQEPPRR